MEYKFTIPGRLEGLNNYTAANRMNYKAGGRMKRAYTGSGENEIERLT